MPVYDSLMTKLMAQQVEEKGIYADNMVKLEADVVMNGKAISRSRGIGILLNRSINESAV